ncbi:hypothetical protein QBC34DRAFT_106152 [Podospora aff. communis PSN243]|uniref:Uncharacterized protein n=1 Tax=Podospora aff. communis PSN243 TaxID=3040156 RepID=A0AAV9H4X8_9PEZI|nr:hypothetical protein QBC34DRAFT_106152 [Podospora aff. communis PSN243]
MDVVYNQHSSSARRKNRSSTNLNHLSLAPLTTKLPLQEDPDFTDSFTVPASYLQGKSAPTTPRLLSRSPGRSHSRSRGTSVPSSAARLPKSKSATHLPRTSAARQRSSHQLYHATSPTAKRRSHDPFIPRDRTDSDWMLRAGALISTETRESKGQAWLVSRASSTSLAGMHPEDDAFERELALEREHIVGSRSGSRRHSIGPASGGEDGDHMSSPPYSRRGSRSQSRVGSRSQMITPLELRSAEEGYFPMTSEDEYIPGPDFVNLDEALEAVDEEFDTTVEDEAYVRRLVKKGNGGMGSWFGSVLGVQLFSVEENSEESDDDGDGETTEGEQDDAEGQPSRITSTRRLDGMTTTLDERVPPPKADEGGWHDAAWLLTVASKVLL